MIRLTIALLGILTFVGCGGSSNGIWITGKLLRNGEPITPPEGYKIGLTFYSMAGEVAEGKAAQGGEPYVAHYDPTDGSFAVSGREGGGIPTGKYRIAISQKLTREAYDEMFAKKKKGGPPLSRDSDVLVNAFGPTTSPIIRELKSSANLTIDMNKPTE